MTIFDRYMLRRAALAFGAAIVCEAAGLLVNPPIATTAGAFALGIGLAVVYGRLVRDREVLALQAAGIAPRRIAAAAVVAAAIVQVPFVVAIVALHEGSARTAYVGDVLSAAQPILIASSALPICIRSRAKEPWAQMALLLAGYVLAVVVASALVRGEGADASLCWLLVIPALVAVDAVLYGAANPRARKKA